MAANGQIKTFAGTGTGASVINPGYDPTQFIKMGVKDGVTQYANNTLANRQILTELASGPLGAYNQGNYTGVWDAASLQAAGNPAGQTAGQAATGNWANRAEAQNQFAAMTRAAVEEINRNPPPGGGVGVGPGDPGYTDNEIGDAFTPGGPLNGTTPGNGDYLTPPPTNANVNQPLTNISQVMQNNSRVPAAAGASTLGGRTQNRPVTTGRVNPTTTATANAVNFGTDSTGAAGKLDQIKKLGIRF